MSFGVSFGDGNPEAHQEKKRPFTQKFLESLKQE
jgi:hypothetical protein